MRSSPLAGARRSDGSAKRESPFVSRHAMRSAPKVYTLTVCPTCDRLREAWAAQGIEYEEVRVDQSQEALDEALDYGGHRAYRAVRGRSRRSWIRRRGWLSYRVTARWAVPRAKPRGALHEVDARKV